MKKRDRKLQQQRDSKSGKKDIKIREKKKRKKTRIMARLFSIIQSKQYSHLILD